MASNLLWAHLLRKNATTTDVPLQIPPIAPQDKTGTSMRMLIHDTQANLEKFSTRLDGLLQRVDDCRGQVVNANKLLDVERDKVLTEILEIAHRCQSELRAHVGTPAQASTLDLVHVSQVSTDKSLQALEKRIDALQLLQTQAHMMQSIQDQQNTLISTVLPLVPVLHGISPQVDQIKASFSEMVANAVSTMTTNLENVRSTLVSEITHAYGPPRSSTRVGSSTSSPRPKRSNVSVLGPQETSVPASSPLDSRSHGGPRTSLKRARVEEVTHSTGDTSFPHKLSRLAVSHSSDPPPLLHTPRTPRQPLADLFLIPGDHTSELENHVTRHDNSMFHGCMRPREARRAAGSPSTSVPPKSRPPLQPLQCARTDLQDMTILHRPSPESRDLISNFDVSAMGLPNASRPPNADALTKATKIEETLGPGLSGVVSIHSSPLSSPPSSLTPTARRDPHERGVNIAQSSGSTRHHSGLQDDAPYIPQQDLVPVPPSSTDPSCLNPDVSPAKPMSLRDRRAQISMLGRTETRRFIPLVPWSDEEE